MIPRLARETPPIPPRTTDLVDGWLSVFLGLLKVPEQQAANIGEEIESHLRERVRDLMLTGNSEGEATRKAISELGEAADVAARYRALRTEPTRRFIMHASLFTAAGAALALSIAAFSGGRSQPQQQQALATEAEARAKAVTDREQDLLARLNAEQVRAAEVQKFLQDSLAYHDTTARNASVNDLLALAAAKANESPAANRDELLRVIQLARASAAQTEGAAEYIPADPPELDELKFDAAFDQVPAAEAFDALGELLKSPVMVQWQPIEASGLGRIQPITLRAKQVTAPAVLRSINESMGLQGARSIECRMSAGTLEIAPREFFDRRERTLVTYDLSGIIAARHETYDEERAKVIEEVTKLLANFVSAEDWRENGGELAQMSVVGDRLFVEAPARMHPQVKWILDQLPSDKKHSDAGAAVPYLSDLPVIGQMYRAPAANPKSGIRIYPMKHVSAEEALKALKSLEGIKRIDFTPFACDARTNSILGRASDEELKMVENALRQIDRPSAKHNEAAPAEPGVASAK